MAAVGTDLMGRPRVRPYPLSEIPRILQLQVHLSRALWRHLLPVVDSAAATTKEGWDRLEAAAGTRLSLRVNEPYLFPLGGAASRVQGGVAVSLEVLGPPPRQMVLVLHEDLGERLLARGLLSLLRAALSGAPVRVIDFCPKEEVAKVLSEGGAASHGHGICLDLLVLTEDGQRWARLLSRADLRLGAGPGLDPEGRTPVRRWRRRQRIAQVKVMLSIEAGYGQLPAGEVAALGPGDLVLLDHFGPRPVVGGPVRLRLGGGAFPAHLTGEGVTLLHPFERKAMIMSERTTPPNHDARLPTDDAPRDGSERLLRELPVQVVCEIGRVMMTGSEVLELGPGAVIPVGRPLSGPVDLTVGGRTIAQGELVDVEGEIGVRVTEMLD